jgi:hypothetical protein
MTAPWFQKYVDSYLNAPGQNDASPYGVSVEAIEGAVYEVIGIHHLDQSENVGKHNIYVQVLDQQGERNDQVPVLWTWEGRTDAALMLALDKPLDEPAGNISLDLGQTVSLWIGPASARLSDVASGFHTRHPDEPPGNTIGHHSYLVVFQHLPAGGGSPPPPIPPAPSGAVDYAAILGALDDLMVVLRRVLR